MAVIPTSAESRSGDNRRPVMARRGVACRVVPRLFAACRVTCRAQYPVKSMELLDPALDGVSIDEDLLANLRIDGDAVEVPLFASALHASDGAGDSSLGKDRRGFLGRQRMSRLVAFRRVIARRVVYGVVHTYSKRTTQIRWGNGGYPQFGVETRGWGRPPATETSGVPRQAIRAI